MPVLRHTLTATFVDLGMSRCARASSPPSGSTPMEPFYPAARARLRRVPARAAPGVRRARGDLHRVRLLLVVLRQPGCEHARPLRRAMIASARARTGRPGGRGRQQRRLPAAALRRARASRCSASSRPRNVADAAESAGVPTLDRVLRRRGRRARIVAASTAAPTSSSANNVLAQVPDLNDFVAGIAVLLAARRRGHARVPAPAAADRGQPVRHDLPRALLLLLAADRASGSSPPTGSTVFDVEELPTHGGSLRVFARARRATTASRSAARVEALRARERGRPGSTRLDGYAGFGPRVEATKRALLELPDRRQARRASTVVGYGAPGKGNTLLNYCGDPRRTSSTTPSTATRTSRASSCPGRTSRSTRPSRSPRPVPTTS